MPLVSVILIIKNETVNTEEVINSIITQTVDNIEILVCDERGIAERISNCDIADEKKINIKYKKAMSKGGLTESILEIIPQSKGKWIAFNDCEIWHPVKLEAQLYVAEKNKVKAVCANALLSEKNGIERCFSEIKENKEYSLRNLLDHNYIIRGSVMIERKLLMSCTADSSYVDHIRTYGMGYAVWLRCACYTNFYFIFLPMLDSMASICDERKYGVVRLSEREKREALADFKNWLKSTDDFLLKYVKSERKAYLFDSLVCSKVRLILDMFRNYKRRLLKNG